MKRTWMNRKGKLGNKGVSLVELLVVIAIMSILASILVPNLLQYIKKAQKASELEIAREIGESLERLIAIDSAVRDQWDKIPTASSYITFNVTDHNGETYRMNNVLELTEIKFRSAAMKESQIICDALKDELGRKNNIQINYTDKYITELRVTRRQSDGRVEVWASNNKEGRSSTVYYRLYPDADPAYMSNFTEPASSASGARTRY